MQKKRTDNSQGTGTKSQIGKFFKKKLFFINDNSWHFRNVDLDFDVPDCDIT